MMHGTVLVAGRGQETEEAMRCLMAALSVVAGGVVAPTHAQSTLDRPIGAEYPYHLDSGPIVNAGAAGTAYLDNGPGAKHNVAATLLR